jgi:protein involved in polysaccharide export with SLBB domain
MIQSSMAGRRSEHRRKSFCGLAGCVPVMLIAVLGLTSLTGCQTGRTKFGAEAGGSDSAAIILREGDVLKVVFPGAHNLDTTQPIRRDGKIAMPLVGEVKAVGMTPADLEKEIVKLYASQLTSKEVTVTVESSTFPVFVTGAVVRPGKVLSDHPITALEAVMEAGGCDYSKANLRSVTVTRHENGRVKTYALDLKSVLEGKPSDPFYLKPSDIVYVPERFSWY